MYKTLQDLDLTPSQRETLEFLIKQSGRYEKVRKLKTDEFFYLYVEEPIPVEFDKLIDAIQENEAKERLKTIDDARKVNIDAL
jgi:hypothetical protein